MLKLWLWKPTDGSEYVHSAGLIFEAEYESKWIEEDIVKRMIADVDESEVVSGNLINSPVFGAIPPVMLSGGVKTLIMASHDDTRTYNLTSCGDNCAKWVLELAKEKDIVMRLGHYMQFEDYEPFEIEILNTKKTVTTQLELTLALIEAE